MRKTIRLLSLATGVLLMINCNKPPKTPPEPQPVVGCIEATYLHSNTCGDFPIFNVETPDTTIKGLQVYWEDKIKNNAVVILNYDVFKEKLVTNNKYYFTYRLPEKSEKVFTSICPLKANPSHFFQLILKEQFTTKCLK